MQSFVKGLNSIMNCQQLMHSESSPRGNGSFFTLSVLGLAFTSSSPLLLSLEGQSALLAGLFLTYLEIFFSSSLFAMKQYLQGMCIPPFGRSQEYW